MLKGKLNKIILTCLTALSLLLAGCSDAAFGTDSMLRPPRTTGSKAQIQEVLSREAGGSYTLKYPQNGDNRTAIMMRNENTDKEYALALYSVENETKIYASIIAYKNGTWECLDTFSNSSPGIDRVLFKDINGDKYDEIIIGWSLYNDSQKMLTVYSMTNDSVNEMQIDERYDEMVVADIINENEDDIITLLTSTETDPAKATVIKYSEKYMRPIGRYSIELSTNNMICFANIIAGQVAVNTHSDSGFAYARSEDGSIYRVDPTESTDNLSAKDIIEEISAEENSDGRAESVGSGLSFFNDLNKKGIVLDGMREDGSYCTDIIYYDIAGDRLINPLSVSSASSYINPTVRKDQIYSQDINGDSVIDVPVVTQMPAGVDEKATNICTLTSWQNYDASGNKLNTIMNAVMYLKDGYYFKMPDRWLGNVTARSNAESRELTFYMWDNKKSVLGDKLLTIYRYTEQQWNEADNGNMIRLDEPTLGKAVYAAELFTTDKNEEMNITAKEVRDMFVIM